MQRGADFMQILRKNRINKKSIVKIRYLKEEFSEKCLWKAVVCQAIDDATSNSKKRPKKYAKNIAIKWLIEDNDDFKAVCDLAGYNYKDVQKSVKKLIKKRKNSRF